jgi:protoporphyrinogen oxidase
MDLTILGGGPAGLGVAHYAHQQGLGLSLYERAAELGGLCRTFVSGDHRYDSGAHRFHDRDPEVTADLRRLLGDQLLQVEATSQIFDRGRFINFPPTPINWLLGNGWREATSLGAEVVKARWRPRPERTFEDVAVNRYGERLAHRLLISYSEKLWGLPASQLAPEVATRRLSGLGLRTLLFELCRYPRRRAHLDGAFLYPRSGYGAIPEALTRGLPPDRLHTGREVAGFEVSGQRITAVRFADGSTAAVAGRLVSTLPLTVLVRCLGDHLPESVRTAAGRLRFRHVRLVFLRLGIPRHSKSATLYLPSPELVVSRLSEPKNRSQTMAPDAETALVAEVPCSTGDALAALGDKALVERVIAELAAIQLLSPRDVLSSETRTLPNAYPVYESGYAAHVQHILNALGGFENLDLVGRGGLFWYSHLHDQLRLAKNYVGSLGADGRLPVSIAPHIRKSASTL